MQSLPFSASGPPRITFWRVRGVFSKESHFQEDAGPVEEAGSVFSGHQGAGTWPYFFCEPWVQEKAVVDLPVVKWSSG